MIAIAAMAVIAVTTIIILFMYLCTSLDAFFTSWRESFSSITREYPEWKYCYTPCRGRVHVSSRSTIPIRFACVERRKTPVFVRFGVQKHVEFQVGLYCNEIFTYIDDCCYFRVSNCWDSRDGSDRPIPANQRDSAPGFHHNALPFLQAYSVPRAGAREHI